MKVHTVVSHQDAITAAGPAWQVMRSSVQILCRAFLKTLRVLLGNESRVPTAGPEDPGFTFVESDCHRIGLLRGAWPVCVGPLRVCVQGSCAWQALALHTSPV